MSALNIAIIGAGLSGLSAAHGLKTSGHKVTIFDKASRAGGRSCTRTMTTEIGELIFDHGTPDFQVTNPEFQGIVNEWHAAGWVHPAGSKNYVGVPKMESLAAQLALSLTTHFNTRVSAILKEQGGFALIFENGERRRNFDRVICAIPAEQAATLLKDIQPDFASNARSVSSHPLWVGMLSFKQDIRSHAGDIFLFKDHKILAKAILESSKPERSEQQNWTVHSCAAFTAAHLEEDKYSVAAQIAQAFARELDTPMPDFYTAHRWRYCQPINPLGQDFLYKNGFGVCGDWLRGGDVQGAWLSGAALANHVSME